MTRRTGLRANRRQFFGAAAGCGAALLCGSRRAHGALDISKISACTERVFDAEEGRDSAAQMQSGYEEVQELAFAASPKNAETYKDEVPAGAPAAIPPTTFGIQQIALTKSLLWKETKDFLNIKMRRTSETRVSEAIERAMAAWQEHLPFTLRFNDSNPDISIQFRQSGHWSFIGVSSQFKDHSMNLQPGLPNENYDRVALHEFGHALGAIHEHQSPGSDIPWNPPAVYEYYRRTQRWSETMTNQQVLEKYDDRTLFNLSEYDSTSIMQYPIPKELLLPGNSEVEWNDKLSLNDKNYMRTSYGRPKLEGGGDEPSSDGDTEKKKQELSRRARLKEADAVAIKLAETKEGSIAEAGELKLYQFELTTKTDAVIETVDDPAADMVIELHKGAPFDEDKAIAVSEKLRGRRLLNAYLQRELDAGKYFALVRHSIHSRQSAFKIHLRKTADAPANSRANLVKEIKKRQQTIRDIQESFLTK